MCARRMISWLRCLSARLPTLGKLVKRLRPVRSDHSRTFTSLPRRPIYFFSVSAGLQWQRIRSLGADLNIGPLIAIGGGGKVSLVEENEFQLAVVIGGQGSLGRVEPNSSSSEFIFETGLNVGMQLDAAAGEPAFLMRVLYSPTVGGIWNSCSLGRCDGPLLRLLAYQIVIGVRTARDASVSAAWAHSLEPNPFASVRVETMALSAQADFLF